MRDMVMFSRLLLLGLPAVWVLAIAAASDDVPAAAARGPGCATRCGDIDVPYPFGLDPQCAIHAGFQLNCTTVGRTTKLFHNNLEVIKLSVQDGKAWLKTWISRECYNQSTSGELYGNYAWMNITGSPYVLSADDNRIIVLGCNSFAYMRSDSYILGCLATCDFVNIPPKNGSCSGNAGCCQVDLPKGVRVYQGYFNSLYNTTAIWRSTPCNYITVMATADFNFSTTYLTSSVFYDEDDSRSPVVMEWGIANKTCEAAKTDKTYACVSNYSECITNEAGYLCKCSKGFKGNSYVAGGCADIDECQDKVTYPCVGMCKNTVGGYNCSCPPGKSLINGICVKKHKSIWMAPVVGGSVGLVVLVTVITCACLIRERRKLHRIKQKYFRQHGGLLLFEEMKSQQGVAFKIFSEEELQQATNRFDEEHVIGHGGHGKVYKGQWRSYVG